MSTVTLYPPLAQIEQRLFAVSDDLLLRLAKDDPSVPEALRKAVLVDQDVLQQIAALRESADEAWPIDAETVTDVVEPPAFIKLLIEHKVAANRADFGQFPESGQLVQLSQAPTPPGMGSDLQFATPLVVLLATQNTNTKVWHGWLVSQEVQYASYWDFLLQPEDEPFDPLCGLVQIWNPVQLYLSGDVKAKAIGRLSPARMRAVNALALAYVLDDSVLPRPRPGFIALRSVGDGLAAVTGTPLGNDNDPRHAYQQCYHHVATLLNEPVLAWQTDTLPTVTDVLSDLYDVLAAVWFKATGNLVRPMEPIAHAMSGQSDENIVMLALQDDLHLTLMHADGRIDLTLVYQGNEHLNVIVIDDGEQAHSTLLKAGLPPLDYRGLAVNADNHLWIELANGQKINLPVKLNF